MTLGIQTLFGLTLLGFFSGLVGSLAGIGGGIIVIPVLVLIFGVHIKIAIATSLIAVVATSTAAGSIYVARGLANLRLGMTLEVATTLGGLSGGILAMMVSPEWLSAGFALLVFVTAILMLKAKEPLTLQNSIEGLPQTQNTEQTGRIAGTYYDPYHQKQITYHATHLMLGSLISLFAGMISGMLGVGGGFIKVPAMHLGMKIPIKVATATSNFMIGVTAISSLFIYFSEGFVHPLIAAPVTLGIIIGALTGTRFSPHLSSTAIKKTVAVILMGASIHMAIKAIGVFL